MECNTLQSTNFMTVILSALFGGLLSALITGYFFEYRDKRQLYLRKYEDVLKIITSHQKRTGEYINRLHNVISTLRDRCGDAESFTHNYMISLSEDSVITAKAFAKVTENKEFFERDVFFYIDEITYIHLIKYYDDKFDSIADSYYRKSNELYEEVKSVFELLDEGRIPEQAIIDHYGKTLDEQGVIAREFINELRIHIQERMLPPWQATCKSIKNFIDRNK